MHGGQTVNTDFALSSSFFAIVALKQSLQGYIPAEALLLKRSPELATELVARPTTAIITASAETASTATTLFASLGFVHV
jgi:hypothetical protein